MKSANGENNFLYPYYPNTSCVFIVHWQIKMAGKCLFWIPYMEHKGGSAANYYNFQGFRDRWPQKEAHNVSRLPRSDESNRNSCLGHSLQLKKLEMTTKLACKDDSAWPLQRRLIHAVDARVVFWWTCGNHHISPFPLVTLVKCDCLRWRIIHQDQWNMLGDTRCQQTNAENEMQNAQPSSWKYVWLVWSKLMNVPKAHGDKPKTITDK